jgi:hypothetical protein
VATPPPPPPLTPTPNPTPTPNLDPDQVSSLIALLWLANYAADMTMLHVLPERKHYRTYKQERTPDFSDLRNKIAEVEGEKKKLRERKNRFAAKLDDQ